MAAARAPRTGAGGGAGAGAESQNPYDSVEDARGGDGNGAGGGGGLQPPHEVFSGDIDSAKELVNVLACLYNGKREEHALVMVNENGTHALAWLCVPTCTAAALWRAHPGWARRVGVRGGTGQGYESASRTRQRACMQWRT